MACDEREGTSAMPLAKTLWTTGPGRCNGRQNWPPRPTFPAFFLVPATVLRKVRGLIGQRVREPLRMGSEPGKHGERVINDEGLPRRFCIPSPFAGRNPILEAPFSQRSFFFFKNGSPLMRISARRPRPPVHFSREAGETAFVRALGVMLELEVSKKRCQAD